ncbi:transcription factor MYBS1-like [Populus alba x Populus x berolinensis]|uniref:Transcription factor MYBS1-like n=1 Tax=Populus alba x Populus x berolinensis TaxID=444605 RepID=A0AAD6M1I1_9ROSI|nr:transcription factor MYBS1-like [Populus alba x Populus x berolinensis]
MEMCLLIKHQLWSTSEHKPAGPAPAMGPPVKHRTQAHMPGLAMYGPPLGHPVAPPPGHMASVVGTPVMLPPPGHHPHPPYVVPVAYPTATKKHASIRILKGGCC